MGRVSPRMKIGRTREVSMAKYRRANGFSCDASAYWRAMSSPANDLTHRPGTDMNTPQDQKLSRGALVALVVGSMVGAGIFALPSAFGRTTGGLGALIAWCIAGTGMLMLAFVFQTLSLRKPDLDAGIYAYAKAGFGNYLDSRRRWATGSPAAWPIRPVSS